MVEERSKVLILGDSELKYIDERKLSNSKNKVIVRSISGLKTSQLLQSFYNILGRSFDQLIVHVGTNDLRMSSVTEILKKYENLTQELGSRHLAFSSIIYRSDSRDLNRKGLEVNEELRKFCKEKGHDYIDNSNLTATHLARDGLHINESGQARIARNYMDYLN